MSIRTDTVWQSLLFCGTGSVTAEVTTMPIDCIKVRLQLQGELGAARRYHGALHALTTTVREEGLGALYKGIQPAVLRQSTYGTLRIGLYEPIKDVITRTPPGGTPPKDTTLWVKLVAGCLSGGMSSALTTPTDVVKVRMQAERTAGAGEAGLFLPGRGGVESAPACVFGGGRTNVIVPPHSDLHPHRARHQR